MEQPVLRRRLVSGAVAFLIVTAAGTLQSCARSSQLTSSPSKARSSAQASPTAWATATVFRDQSSHDSFSIQLQSGRPDSGKFDYVVIGQGDYLGVATMTSKEPDVIEISSSGTATFDPLAGQPLSPVSVRLDGAILQREDALTMEIWIGGTHAHFQTGTANPAMATAYAEQVVTSMAQHDWVVLYAMLAPEIEASFASEQQFANSVDAVDIVEASLAGSPTISSASGYTYYRQAVALKIKDSSGIRASKTTLYLVYETGRWYLLGNDPPTPAS